MISDCSNSRVALAFAHQSYEVRVGRDGVSLHGPAFSVVIKRVRLNLCVGL
jgi:hypothetical protein